MILTVRQFLTLKVSLHMRCQLSTVNVLLLVTVDSFGKYILFLTYHEVLEPPRSDQRSNGCPQKDKIAGIM